MTKFFDEEADVDDEEDMDDGGERGDISQTEIEEIYKRYDTKRGLTQQRKNIYENMDDEQAEEYAQNLEKKYQNNFENYEEDREATNLFPSLSDPILWLVKCKLGSEREACICLMNKYLDLKRRGQPLKIISATISDKVQGNLYVEAFKEAHVRDAVKGLRLIYQREVTRIKKEETASVFEIDKATKSNLKRGQWVRINTGLYTGDYAKIEEIDQFKDGCY